jgi:hypothetical protein
MSRAIPIANADLNAALNAAIVTLTSVTLLVRAKGKFTYID